MRYITFAEVIKNEIALLREKGISSAEIARRANISDTTAWRLVNDLNSQISLDIINKLEHAELINPLPGYLKARKLL